MFHRFKRLPDQFPILSDPLIAEMQNQTIQKNAHTGYGIGWEIDDTAETPVVSHSGGMPGVNTWLRLVPSRKLTVVVVLANADNRLAHTISDRILSKLATQATGRKLRGGRVLNGAICARADEGRTMPASVIFPSELNRPYERTIQKKGSC